MELKTIELTKKFGSKTAVKPFEYNSDKWRLWLVRRKWGWKDYIYATVMQYSNSHVRENCFEW